MTEFKLCEEMGLKTVEEKGQWVGANKVILASDVEKMLQGGEIHHHYKEDPFASKTTIIKLTIPNPVLKAELIQTLRLIGKQETHDLADRIEKAGISE